jgi:hypothetical protein
LMLFFILPSVNYVILLFCPAHTLPTTFASGYGGQGYVWRSGAFLVVQLKLKIKDDLNILFDLVSYFIR